MTTTLARPVSEEASAAATRAVAVSVRDLRKRFLLRRTFAELLRHPLRREYQSALNGVDCDILQGEFFGFLGANGAGKTTLFKILATLITPDEGDVRVGGLEVRRDAAAVRRLLTPVIADERSLKWRLTAKENLRLYAVLYGTPHRQVDRRVAEVLDTVGLSPTDTKLVGRYSSGMKQRLMIARALIPNPKILLLDEPTRSLDPVSARQLRDFLRNQICKTLGCTVLLATHTAEEAFEMCDRVAIMDRGRTLVVGPTERLVLEFSDERYRIWTRDPDHRAFAALTEARLLHSLQLVRFDDDGWAVVDAVIPAGLDSAAEAMRLLVARGVNISRFERVGLSLAELIQRVVSQRGGAKRA
jgi:ABC-2 type transport system ATP-binding protein